MSGAHRADLLYMDRRTAVHDLPPQCKVLATVLFVFAVVLTPREAWWAFFAHVGVIVVVAVLARVQWATFVRRLRLELPFVAFALFLPLVGTGRRVDVLGASLSVAGLWGAWNIVVKGTLGVAATGVLVATTPVPDLLIGLERLRIPRVFVAIMGSMIRYGDVIAGELQRIRVARLSRAHDPRWIWQARAVAAGAGALFVRSYERGERVYVAMQSRGFDGSLPVLDERPASRASWLGALTPPALAVVVAIAAVVLGP